MNPYQDWLGISGADQTPDHYALLGLEPFEPDRVRIEQASLERARIVRKYHVGAFAEQAQQLLYQIAAARVCLLDPKSKEEYDSRLRNPSPIQSTVGSEQRLAKVSPSPPGVPSAPSTELTVPPAEAHAEAISTAAPEGSELAQPALQSIAAIFSTESFEGPEAAKAAQSVQKAGPTSPPQEPKPIATAFIITLGWTASALGSALGVIRRIGRTTYSVLRWMVLGPEPDLSEAGKKSRSRIEVGLRVLALIIGLVFLVQTGRFLATRAGLAYEFVQSAITQIAWWNWGIAFVLLVGVITLSRWIRGKEAARSWLVKLRQIQERVPKKAVLATGSIVAIAWSGWMTWGSVQTMWWSRPKLRDGFAVELTEAERLEAIPIARRHDAGTFRNSLGMEMVCILPGKYRREEEVGAKWGVIETPYWMASHEVTVAQFLYFAKEHRLQAKYPEWLREDSPAFVDVPNSPYAALGKDLYRNGSPIVGITIEAAQGFCEWLNRRISEPVIYCLPTRDEWMCAYRAGTDTASWWRDEVGRETCNLTGTSDGFPYLAQVGRFPPNRWGICDMAGNAWEMVATENIVLGGSWTSTNESEFSRPRKDAGFDLGFRVAARRKTPER